MRPQLAFTVFVAIVAASAVAGCGSATVSPTESPSQAPAATPSATVASSPPTTVPSASTGSASAGDGVTVVILGDSASTGHGDPEGRGWGRAYADLVDAGTELAVDYRNLAQDGTTTAALLARLESDTALRDAVAAADIVAIGMGGNELGIGDAAMESGRCSGPACYDEPAAIYRNGLDAVVTEVERLRDGKPTAVRAIGMWNALTGAETVIPPFLRTVATDVGAYQAGLFDTATCEVMAAHKGACAALRTAFNGPEGTDDAYASGLLSLTECCYPTAAGHALIAKLLYETGLEPVASGSP